MKLFLDDERFPPDGPDWWIVRDMPEAIQYMEAHGCPLFISFDHDLGEGKHTGADLARWMVNRDLDTDGKFIPSEFTYYVHSQNPVGATNITGWLDGYLSQR
jgi:hypothetical protein